MTGLEHARHDVSDAQSSVESALDVLTSLERDGCADCSALQAIIKQLNTARSELDGAADRLAVIEEPVNA